MTTVRDRLAVVLSSDAIGLGAVRSLAAARIPTVAVLLNRWEPTRVSRFATKRLVPTSRDLESGLLSVLADIDAARRPFLLPTSDFLADFVARHRAVLDRRFVCAVPPAPVIATVMDKARDTRTLCAAGIPVPHTIYPLPDSADQLIARDALPLLVKPRTYRDKNALGWRNAVLRTPEHVRAFYHSNRSALGRVIAQELIPGDDDALWECIAVFDERSEMRSAFTFRKLRTMPAHFGQTSYGRSERNEAVLDIVRAIGKHLRYVGPADVDLKYDARDGTYKYLELNPRLGMCNGFATRCGVNVVLDAYRIASGASPPLTRQRDGKRFLALLEDIGGQVQSGDGPLRIALETVRALAHGPVGAYFAWNDVGPGPFAVARLCVRLIERAWRGQLEAVFTRDYGRFAPRAPATRDAAP